MDIRKVKIVADSACDLFELADVAFDVAPLKIITAEKEYVDTKETDVTQMVEDLLHYHGRSSTSCPNAQKYTAFWFASHPARPGLRPVAARAASSLCRYPRSSSSGFPSKNLR